MGAFVLLFKFEPKSTRWRLLESWNEEMRKVAQGKSGGAPGLKQVVVLLVNIKDGVGNPPQGVRWRILQHDKTE